MEDQGKELREAIVGSRSGKSRWRCPSSLRTEIVAFLKAGRESGATLSTLSSELGIGEATVSRWIGQESGRLRRVQVKSSVRSGSELRLVTPRGYRVEGLSVEAAAELLSRL